MPAAVAIPAALGAIGVGGSLFSGITGANAASKAAGIQSAAANAASANTLATNAEVNPELIGAANAAGQSVVQAGQWAGQGVTSAAQQANQLLNPYTQAGSAASTSLQAGLAPGGQFVTAPTAAQIQMDPGFQARLAASDAVNMRLAAATGNLQSGSTAMALNAYDQTQASQEYQNAFNRYETSTQNAFNNLNMVAGRGQAAAGLQGSNIYNAGVYSGNVNYGASQYANSLNYGATNQATQNTIKANEVSNNYLTGGANARAAGVIGSANAITGAVNQGLSALGGAGSLYGQMNNPFSMGGGGGFPNYAPGISTGHYSGNNTWNPDGSLTVGGG